MLVAFCHQYRRTALCLGVAALILFVRRPDAFVTPQFWAEDGVEFYQRAYIEGGRALATPYASYLHAIPRLVAHVTTALDPRWATVLFVGCAGAATLYVVALARSSRCPLAGATGCALAVVLVPDTGEVLLNLTNLQWIAVGAFLLLLISADADNRAQQLHDGTLALLLGLTGPFSILFAPLFWWRALARRTWASAVLAGIVTFTGAVQAWTVWRYPPGAENKPVDTTATLAVPGMRVAGSLLAGISLPDQCPRPVEIGLGLATLAAIAALGLRRGPVRLERIWLALAFGALLVSSLFRCRYVLPQLCHAGFGSRYFYPLQLVALWLLLAATNDERRWLARGATLVALWMAAVNLPRLCEGPLPDCKWPAYAPKIRAGEAVSVPINPAPWTIDLPARKH